jgi:death-on-curing protein
VASSFYPSVLDALALHRFIMERTGQIGALRDEGALASALMRPQMAARYEEADLPTQAVRLMAGIALAHALVDGNKRTALIVGDTFLRENGYHFTGDYVELAKQIEAVLTRADSLDHAEARFADWLRPQLQPRSSS